jgi:hypothetical protein
MADEIKIPCNLWRHPTRNANAYEDTLDQTNDEFVAKGIVLPDIVYSRLCFEMTEPVPADYDSTPKLRVYWKTKSTDTSSNMELEYEIENFTPQVDSEDEATWTIDSAVQDISNGQFEKNIIDISLAGLSTLAIGDFVLGTIARDAQVGNGSDTLADLAMITHVVFIGSIA